jgi:hypothetical protein
MLQARLKWPHPSVGGKNHRAIARAFVSENSFGEVDGGVQKVYQSGITNGIILCILLIIKALVRKGGFEPPRLSAPPPQDGVSANSTTSALKSITYNDFALP